MSSRSPAAPKKSRFRKFLGNLKDGFRSSSSSRPASPHLRDTSASTVDLRPPPIALSRSPSLVAITQPVSLVTSIIGAPATVPSSVDGIPAVTVTEPSAQSASVSEPSTGNKLKKAGNTAWIVLKLALDALEKSSDAFPPLKSAVAAFNACLSIVENAAANRGDYEIIANELRTMVETVKDYANEFAAEDENGSIQNIISSMIAAVEKIQKKQERGKVEQMAMSKQDKDDVMDCYRQIEISFRRLQTLTGLWTARKMDRHHEQKLLQDMWPEEDARYNSGYGEKIKRRSCTAKTRERIQQELQDWACDSKDANIYWMNGMAGTGKTTIAFSLCKWLESNKQLGASFFCSRAKDSCRDPSRIIPTLACQLGRYSPHFRSELCRVLDVDSGVTKLNVVQQFEMLIKGPLLKVKDEMPEGVVIVIDALDECQESDTVRLIFQTLTQFAAISPVKFFIASRPEYAIRTTVQQPISYSPATFRLQDIEDWIVAGDIEKYLIEAFSLKSLALSDDEIKQLVKIADKLFIYAATVVRYVVPDQLLPADCNERLKEILASPQLRDPSESSEEYKDLDALYSTILEAALTRGLKKKERERIERVLWTAICAKEPMSVTTLASLLDLSEDLVLSALSPLHSVLDISSGDRVVSTLHASFPDYMLDSERSKGFACNAMTHSDLLAHSCFVLMKKQLRFNICNLKSSLAFDSDIPDFGGLINRCISSALFYACRYWSAHLRLSNISSELTAELDEFISHRLLFWMEVLNVNRCIVRGVSILRQAQDWLQVKDSQTSVRNLVADARNFVTRFVAGACKRSTPHIYTSALPFCPKESLIYKQYWGRTKGLVSAEGTAINGLAQAAISTWMISSLVMSVAISSDGRHIVSGSSDQTIRVWNAQTGELVAGPLQGHTGWVYSVGFSPDGKHIVSGSTDKTIRVWDAQTGQLVAGPLQGHTGWVKSAGFSPDGKHIVSGSDDKTIRVWDALTGQLVAGPLQGHTGWVKSVGFSPDGKHIVSGSNDKTIRVWDALTGQLVAGPLQGHTDSVNSVVFSPDGKHIVSGSGDKTIRVWDAQTGELVAGPLQGHTGWVNSVVFSPDGKHIVSGSDDHTIRLWDAQTGQLVAGPLQGHTRSVNSVVFSPDGKHIVSGSDDHTIRVWDAQTGQVAAGPLQGHTDSVNSVGFSPDGKHIVSGSDDHTIRVWDAQTGQLVAGPLQGHTGWVNSVVFSPDGKHIVSGSNDKTIRVWNAQTGELVAGPLQGHTDSVKSVGFSPDGKHIVSGSDDHTIRVWDALTGQLVAGPLQGHTGWVKSAGFSPDGKHIVSGSNDKTIHVWDAQTGELVAGPLPGHTDSVTSVVFSPDGKHIVSGSDDQTIRVWDAQTGELVAGPLQGHTSWVYSVGFSPDGKHIISGSSDKTIRVWDAQTGEPAAETFQGHTDSVKSVGFSPDGKRVVSGSDDHTIRVWDAQTGELVAGLLHGHTGYINSVGLSPNDNGIIFGSADSGIQTLYSIPGIANLDVTLTQPDQNISVCPHYWGFEDDGWITLNDQPYLWISPHIRVCFPSPLHPLAIGPQGSIYIDSWNLLIGDSWSKCYISQ